MRPGLRILLLLLALLPACGSTPDEEDSAPPPPERIPRLALPDDWLTCSPWEFERLAAEVEAVHWTREALEQLATALEATDLGSVRAAVLLARGEERSREVLLARLERRVEGPLRHSDAGDVIAAAALRRWEDVEVGERLAALATGTNPHPDLEVRVECGAVALDLGRDETIPFLLRVLHAGTPAELLDPVDWRPTETLSWAKSRAAEALSRRAGVPDTFVPDGSFEGQMSVADELAGRLEITRP